MKKNDTVFIRTVTYHYVGRIAKVTRSWVALTDCSWVADSGRFGAALETGALNEVERMPGTVLVAKATIVDVSEWKHSVPVATK